MAKKKSHSFTIADWDGHRASIILNDQHQTRVEGTVCGIENGCLHLVDCNFSEIGDQSMIVPLTSIVLMSYAGEKRELPPSDDL